MGAEDGPSCSDEENDASGNVSQGEGQSSSGNVTLPVSEGKQQRYSGNVAEEERQRYNSRSFYSGTVSEGKGTSLQQEVPGTLGGGGATLQRERFRGGGGIPTGTFR